MLSIFVDRATQPVRSALPASARFTARETEVLKLLVAARSNREIARTLGIEERTVKAHVAKLMRKVGVENRIALSIFAVTNSIVTSTPGLKGFRNYCGPIKVATSGFLGRRPRRATWPFGLHCETAVGRLDPGVESSITLSFRGNPNRLL